jgi:VCBS repeat-containing protein
MSSLSRAVVALVAAVLACSAIVLIGDCQESNAAYPGENGRIVFVGSYDPGAVYEDIWVVHQDGTGPAQLTETENVGEWSPKWSPDGSEIAFTSTDTADGNREVFVMDQDGSNVAQVTDLAGLWGAIRVSWSPDGSKFVVEIEYWGASYTDLFVVNRDGTGLTQITDFVGSEEWPAWSPDGTRIAFYSYYLGTTAADIWTVAPDGSDLTQVTDDPRRFHRMDWSPDGSQLVLEEYDGLIFANRIWVVDADGSNLTPITDVTPGAGASQPSWSPDGTRLVYRESGLLWTMDADGSTPTSVGVDGAFPDCEEVNDPPVAVDDGPYDAVEDEALVVDSPGVLDNDTDPNGDSLTSVQVSDPSNGTADLNDDGSFTYMPDPGYSGSDSFTYHAEDPGGLTSEEATVTINVEEVNDPPVAVDDGPYDVVIGGSVSEAAPGVLVNDTDAEGGVLEAVKKTDPAHGTVTLNANGSFTYTHDGSDATTDSFTYQAKDTADAMSNVATVSLSIGDKPPPVVDGHTTGLVDPLSGKWYLYDSDGVLVTSFFYGNPGDYPFMGDWDGDGVETPGLYRQSDGYVYLRNSNDVGVADIKFFFGNPGDVPIAGDFNADGIDTVSIYRPSNQTFYIINKLGENDGGLGTAEFSHVFGNPGDKPFVGDFDGDGMETAGLHRESTGLVYFRNSHTQGNADAQFIFGDPGDRLIAGDWNDDGKFSPALYRPSNMTVYFRLTNTQGNADAHYIPSPNGATWLPVAGDR